MIYFSSSTVGFYDDSIHNHQQIPSDAVQITADEHAALLAAQSAGKLIQADGSGNPVAIAPVVTVAQAQAAQETLLQAACQEAITAGFTSAALGAARQYPSQLTDQQNLMANLAASQGAAASWTIGIWCATTGAWSLQQHSASQLAQVNADWVAFRGALQQKYAALVAKVQAATTNSAVQAITWS